MRFFPSLTEYFTSPLPPAELLERVRVACSPTSPPASLPGPFQGTVFANSFTLRRVISYRNDVRPEITGTVEPNPASGGSRLRLRHRLPPLVLVFAAIWLLFISFAALVVGSAALEAKAGLDPNLLIPVGMLLFGVLFFTLPFWSEVQESRPLLVQLLALEPAPSA